MADEPTPTKPINGWDRLKNSGKFWTGLGGLALMAATGAVMYFGLDVAPAKIQTYVEWIMYVTMTLVGAQAVVGAGKEKAVEDRKTLVFKTALEQGAQPEDAVALANKATLPELKPAVIKPSTTATVTKVGLVLLVLGAIVGAFSMAGCDTLGAKGAAGVKAGIACGKESIKAKALELVPVMDMAVRSTIAGDGTFDKNVLKSVASRFLDDVPRCAFRSAVAALLANPVSDPNSPQSEPLALDREALSKTLEEIRVDEWGGVEFKDGQ